MNNLLYFRCYALWIYIPLNKEVMASNAFMHLIIYYQFYCLWTFKSYFIVSVFTKTSRNNFETKTPCSEKRIKKENMLAWFLNFILLFLIRAMGKFLRHTLYKCVDATILFYCKGKIYTLLLLSSCCIIYVYIRLLDAYYWIIYPYGALLKF